MLQYFLFYLSVEQWVSPFNFPSFCIFVGNFLIVFYHRIFISSDNLIEGLLQPFIFCFLSKDTIQRNIYCYAGCITTFKGKPYIFSIFFPKKNSWSIEICALCSATNLETSPTVTLICVHSNLSGWKK